MAQILKYRDLKTLCFELNPAARVKTNVRQRIYKFLQLLERSIHAWHHHMLLSAIPHS